MRELNIDGNTLTARRKANISSWPDSMETIPVGAPPELTFPSAKTSRLSFAPSVSVSNWKLKTEVQSKQIMVEIFVKYPNKEGLLLVLQ